MYDMMYLFWQSNIMRPDYTEAGLDARSPYYLILWVYTMREERFQA